MRKLGRARFRLARARRVRKDLGDDECLAEVGKTEDDETRRLRIAILDAEQEEDKMAAADQLIAQLAAKDAEIEQLKAKLAEIQG